MRAPSPVVNCSRSLSLFFPVRSSEVEQVPVRRQAVLCDSHLTQNNLLSIQQRAAEKRIRGEPFFLEAVSCRPWSSKRIRRFCDVGSANASALFRSIIFVSEREREEDIVESSRGEDKTRGETRLPAVLEITNKY